MFDWKVTKVNHGFLEKTLNELSADGWHIEKLCGPVGGGTDYKHGGNWTIVATQLKEDVTMLNEDTLEKILSETEVENPDEFRGGE